MQHRQAQAQRPGRLAQNAFEAGKRFDLLDITAAAEAPPRAAQNHHAHVLLIAHRFNPGGKIVQEADGEGVDGRVIDDEFEDPRRRSDVR